MPIGWTFTQPPGVSNATESDPTLLQPFVPLAAGTEYIVVLNDATDYYNSYGPTEVQVVGSGSTECISSVPPSQKQVNFAVGGPITECGQMGIFYEDAIGTGPYTLVALPLDKSFSPFVSNLSTQSTITAYWNIVLPAGTRFTVAIGNVNGYYTGGIGAAYEVGPGDGSCVTSANFHPTGQWPAAATIDSSPILTASVSVITGTPIRPSTTTLPIVQTTVTVSPSIPTSSSQSASSSSSSAATSSAAAASQSNAAVIGGAVGGGGAALIGVIFGVWLWRRKRNSNPRVDLYDGPGNGPDEDPKYEPFVQPQQGYQQGYTIQPILSAGSPSMSNDSQTHILQAPSSTDSTARSRTKSTYTQATYIDHQDAGASSSASPVIDVPPAYIPSPE